MHILAHHGARTVTDTGLTFSRHMQYIASNVLTEFRRDISIGCRDIDCQTWSKIEFLFHIFVNFDVS